MSMHHFWKHHNRVSQLAGCDQVASFLGLETERPGTHTVCACTNYYGIRKKNRQNYVHILCPFHKDGVSVSVPVVPNMEALVYCASKYQELIDVLMYIGGKEHVVSLLHTTV